MNALSVWVGGQNVILGGTLEKYYYWQKYIMDEENLQVNEIISNLQAACLAFICTSSFALNESHL